MIKAVKIILFFIFILIPIGDLLAHNCANPADCERTAGYNVVLSVVGGILAGIIGIIGATIIPPTIEEEPPGSKTKPDPPKKGKRKPPPKKQKDPPSGVKSQPPPDDIPPPDTKTPKGRGKSKPGDDPSDPPADPTKTDDPKPPPKTQGSGDPDDPVPPPITSDPDDPPADPKKTDDPKPPPKTQGSGDPDDPVPPPITSDPDDPTTTTDDPTSPLEYTCPECGAVLAEGQSVCASCSQPIDWNQPTDDPKDPPPVESKGGSAWACPECGKPLPEGAENCTSCNQPIDWNQPTDDPKDPPPVEPKGSSAWACPECGKPLPEGAENCTHCNQPIDWKDPETKPPPVEPKGGSAWACPECGKPLPEGVENCGHCNQPIDWDDPETKPPPLGTPCVKCGMMIPEGESICTNCGTDTGQDLPQETNCIKCGIVLAPGVTVCPKCNAEQPEEKGQEPEKENCSNCGTMLEAGVTLCPKCGQENKEEEEEKEEKEEQQQCSNCGTVLEAGVTLCPECKHENKEGKEEEKEGEGQYCSNCGATLEEGVTLCPECKHENKEEEEEEKEEEKKLTKKEKEQKEIEDFLAKYPQYEELKEMFMNRDGTFNYRKFKDFEIQHMENKWKMRDMWEKFIEKYPEYGEKQGLIFDKDGNFLPEQFQKILRHLKNEQIDLEDGNFIKDWLHACGKELFQVVDDEGNLSYKGLAARMMIGYMTGGQSEWFFTAGDAGFRLKDGYDKGERGLELLKNTAEGLIIDEIIGRVGGKVVGESLEQLIKRFPGIENKPDEILKHLKEKFGTKSPDLNFEMKKFKNQMKNAIESGDEQRIRELWKKDGLKKLGDLEKSGHITQKQAEKILKVFDETTSEVYDEAARKMMTKYSDDVDEILLGNSGSGGPHRSVQTDADRTVVVKFKDSTIDRFESELVDQGIARGTREWNEGMTKKMNDLQKKVANDIESRMAKNLDSMGLNPKDVDAMTYSGLGSGAGPGDSYPGGYTRSRQAIQGDTTVIKLNKNGQPTSHKTSGQALVDENTLNIKKASDSWPDDPTAIRYKEMKPLLKEQKNAVGKYTDPKSLAKAIDRAEYIAQRSGQPMKDPDLVRLCRDIRARVRDPQIPSGKSIDQVLADNGYTNDSFSKACKDMMNDYKPDLEV